ncbi:MAG: (d)CMP kinase [Chloroflexia bacterium]|nr:(d)CMP kinase [Chloroflexia bacterium]
MLQPSVIAIDGPAGAGKSTLGALLANHLGYLYFDTGVMYRALALVALQARLDLHDEAEMAKMAYEVQIEVTAPTTADGRQYTVLVNGEDVTWAIRSPEVERTVSLVARYPQVRREMVRQQQQIGRRGNTVMVGRDIGTIVMPDADLKIFLEASLEERARRRAVERDDDPDQTVMAQIQQDLARRDQLDDHVLQPANDAVILQTDGLSPDDELAWILDYLAGHHNA